MNKSIMKFLSLTMVLCMIAGIFVPAARATETKDEAVAAVEAQLNAIDSLQTMQNKRSEYTVKNNHYDTGTTDTAIAEEHNAAREGYETYVAEMFSARLAAQQAYDALTDVQKAQVDPALVEKLNNDLPTVFEGGTFSVTPRKDAYTFEAVKGGTGLGYEVSNYMVSGQIPQTFILVDTSDGKTSWTPSGLYSQGESNYEVAYCCDVETGLEYTTDYKRVNLEDSNYYGKEASKHIRAILLNSYPYVTMDEMKAFLIQNGMKKDFVDSLNRSDMISAVQMAVWTYANSNDGAKDGLGYFATVSIPKNKGIYYTAMHDHTNETWEWQPGKRQRSYDARAEYRVNNLAHFLCTLDGVEADDDQIVISDVEVTRAQLVPGSNDTFEVGMYVHLNHAGAASDKLNVYVESYHTDTDGNKIVTDTSARSLYGETVMPMSVMAKDEDTINVTVSGTQTVAKGVYFYEPEGGRDVSQSLVGVSQGKTNVHTEEEFGFKKEDFETGLRLYKTDKNTQLPISDITFNIYKVEAEVDLAIAPTEEEIAQYATEENKAGSFTTDATGYGAIALDKGTYLVIEEHNKDKTKSVIEPFYIALPQEISTTNNDGTVTVETINIVSLYPKNEMVTPPEEPPFFPPTPDDLEGQFEIIKHDAKNPDKVLAGAQFEVYQPAVAGDETAKIIIVNGVKCAVTNVLDENGNNLILTTDENGYASSGTLPCGTYFLLEIKAPNGYNLLTDAVDVFIASSVMDAEPAPYYIANMSGTDLPSTGGIGTTIFYIVGGIMVIGSCILLITKKRMNNSEDDE